MSKIIYASQTGAKLDSNVFTGGGTDDTAVLQAVLDDVQADESLYLIMDGAALVTQLRVGSNTTIKCLDRNCGFFQKAWSNCALIRNRNWNDKVIENQHICLDGGTYNQDCTHQIHHDDAIEDLKASFTMCAVFAGVAHLTLKNLALRNQRTFALLVKNFEHVDIENVDIELPDKMFAQNQDGLHFWGPGRYLTIRNVKGNVGDDFIALAPDEDDFESSITDVLIDGIILEEADQAIRMLVRDKGYLDRVVVKNVVGTYHSFGFFINPWFYEGPGRYGNITIDTVDLRQMKPDYLYTTNMLFRLGGIIESLTLKNIHYYDPSDKRVLFEIGAGHNVLESAEHERAYNHIKSLVIDGLHICQFNDNDGNDEFANVRCKIDNLIMRNMEVLRDENTPVNGCLLHVMEGGQIDNLVMSDALVKRLDTLIKSEGKIGTLQLSNILYDKVRMPISGEETIGSINQAGVFSK